MIQSMTGFSRVRKSISPWGKVILEIRSVNHRFLDMALHLPEGLLHLEPRLKDEIARRIKRGRITCRLEINYHELKRPVFNQRLIKEYYFSLQKISRQLKLKQDISINALIGLPGIWAIQPQPYVHPSWTRIKSLVKEALDELVRQRQREGRVLYKDLGVRMQILGRALEMIKARFKKAIKQRLKLYADTEKNSFLKSTDINEEIVRLSFHLKNFARCIRSKKAAGKELDFILQEMQREANTIGAKSIDALISGRVVRIKSAIERMREQVQNVE